MKKYLFFLVIINSLNAKAQESKIPVVKYLMQTNCDIRPKPEPLSGTIEKLMKGDTIILSRYISGYWWIKKGDKTGFINEIYITNNNDVNNLKAFWVKLLSPPKADFELKIGVTNKYDFEDRYGAPTLINKTELKGIVSEQWVYSSDLRKTKYFYFTNGILSGIQD